ncbi:hypothetical protein JCM5353_002399 [Sporobolomyces roseus]
MIVRNSRAGYHAYIGCNLRDARQDRCTHEAVARCKEGVVIVSNIELQHTCSKRERERKSESAKIKSRERIAILESELQVGNKSEGGDTGSERKKRTTGQGQGSGEVRGCEKESLDEGSIVEDESSSDSSSIPKKRVRYAPKSPTSEAFSKDCPSARDVKMEIDELKSKGPVHLPSPGTPFDTLRELLIVLFAHSEQRNYSLTRREPGKRETIRKTLFMHCSRRNGRFKDASDAGLCTFEIYGSKLDDGKWRFDKVIGFHNHPVLVPSVDDDEMAPVDGQGISQAKSDPSDDKLFALPTPRGRFASTSTLPSLAPGSNMAPPPLPRKAPSFTSTLQSSPQDLISFLRAFDFPEPDLAHTLSILRLSGIDSLDTLISVLAMEEENLTKFLGMLSDETVGKKIVEMAEDLRKIMQMS